MEHVVVAADFAESKCHWVLDGETQLLGAAHQKEIDEVKLAVLRWKEDVLH